MALLSGGILLLSHVQGAQPLAEIVPCLVLSGIGVGLFSSANNSALMGAVSRERQGVANGVVSTARQLGMMFGVATCTAVYRARHPVYSPLGESGATIAAVQDGFFLVAAIVAVGGLTSFVRGATDSEV